MIACLLASLDDINMLIDKAPESCHIVDNIKGLALHLIAGTRRDGVEKLS